MLDYFDQLGTLVHERWRSKNFDEARFADIATHALCELPPTRAVDLAELVRWTLTTDHFVAQQLDSDFAEPALWVYKNELFSIQVLFWLDGTPEIHQHGFSGAFHVLAGSSVHSRYAFDIHERVNARMLLGDLRLRDVEYLAASDTRPIGPGNQLIHSTFHLDRPSVTVLVRTRTNNEALPHYLYSKPTLAYAPSEAREQTTRQLQLLAMLREIGHPDYGHSVAELVARADFETTFLALRENQPHLEPRAAAALLEQARRRHGGLVDYLPPVLDEDRRVGTLIDRRRSVRDPHHRFLLALLLNLPDQGRILDLVRRRYGGDPVERVVTWLEELTRLPSSPSPLDNGKRDGCGNDGQAEANALGLNLNHVSLRVIRGLLEGRSQDGIAERLEQEYGAAAVNGQKKELGQLCAELQRSVLLRPLLAH
jgi:hypothetical protein